MTRHLWQALINRAATIAERDAPFDLRPLMTDFTCGEYVTFWNIYLGRVER